ncbi:MAG: hypothetical protein EXS36_05125 [Pedosphaera sp.]|nr:hypothetical protein [Pedosphaera sp.]
MKKTWIRVVVCMLAGSVGGLLVFGLSPMILLGVLFGFLVGRTWVGLAEPSTRVDRGSSGVSSPVLSLFLVFLGWGGALTVIGFAAASGLFGRDGSGLLFLFVFVPLLSFCGLLGGPTATSAASRALQQVESGARPETQRGLARWALRLSYLTTAILVGFLLWVLR